jgi:hypothetical protein
MSTHRQLLHVSMRTSGSAGGAHRAPSTRTARAWATRGILVLALVLGSLGAVALASPGHHSAGHAHASAHQPATAKSVTSGQINKMPWMY